MKKPILYLLLEIGGCLCCLLLSVLFSLWPQEFFLIAAYACSHVLYLIAALFLPLIAAKKGTNAFVCALPPFLLYLIVWTALGLNLPALPTILSLVFAVLGANIGAELKKRAK